MRAFFADLWSLLKRYRQGFLATLLLSLVLVFVASGTGIYLSSQSTFCDTCHYMKPYVAAWKTSSHSSVECDKCHFPEDAIGYGLAKAQGIASAIRYLIGTNATHPVAEVEDAVCLKSGCHQQKDLGEDQMFAGRIHFTHEPHLKQTDRGITLRCTSCHAQIVQGEHIVVGTEICIQCHFQGADDRPELTDCRICHKAPDRSVTATGARFAHEHFLERGIACTSCHQNVVAGSGRVTLERCRSCHMEPEKTERLAEHEALHRAHVTERKVECFECHTEISHKRRVTTEGNQAECSSCHQLAAISSTPASLGGEGTMVSEAVNSMHELRVDCTSCHRGNGDHDAKTRHLGPTPKGVCGTCHVQGYNRILGMWKAMLDQQRRRLSAPLASVQAAGVEPLDTEDAARRAEILDQARILEGQFGVHNIFYAKAVIGELDRKLADWAARHPDTAARGTPFDTRALENSCTRRCHVVIEERVSWRGFDFPHTVHLKDEFDCLRCHSHKQRHGTIIDDRHDLCLSCHHQDEDADCGHCHHFQQEFIQGGPKREDALVAPMFKRTDTCDSCHDVEAVAEGEVDDDTLLGECRSCHKDEDFNRHALSGWRLEEKRLLDPLGRRLIDAQNAVATLPAPVSPEIADVMTRCADELQKLRVGRLAHNPVYARALAEGLSGRLAVLEERLAAQAR